MENKEKDKRTSAQPPEEFTGIKIKKAKLLDKADEAAKNVSEIKEIMINHKSETNQIDKLKSEICVSTNILSEIKNQVSSLEQEKEDLYIKNINLE